MATQGTADTPIHVYVNHPLFGKQVTSVSHRSADSTGGKGQPGVNPSFQGFHLISHLSYIGRDVEVK